MDNATLSKAQLHVLISYIEKRGFHEPLTVVEILDHFACKVEEKMKANPAISLENAMAEAHADFGPLGFAPIAKAFEAGVNKKYKTIYRAGLRKAFKNPMQLGVALLAAFVFYKGYYWAYLHHSNHIFGTNDMGALLYFTTIIFPVAMLLKYKQNRKQNPIINAIMYRLAIIYFVIISVTCQPEPPSSLRGLTFLLALGTVAVFYYTLSLFTMQATMKKGYADSAIYYDYLKTIKG